MTAFACEQRVRIARHRHDGLGNAFGLGANGGRRRGVSCRLAAALGAGGRGGLIPDGYCKPGVSTGGRPKGAPIETEPPGSQGLAWLADHRRDVSARHPRPDRRVLGIGHASILDTSPTVHGSKRSHSRIGLVPDAAAEARGFERSFHVSRWRPDWMAGAAGFEPLHIEITLRAPLRAKPASSFSLRRSGVRSGDRHSVAT